MVKSLMLHKKFMGTMAPKISAVYKWITHFQKEGDGVGFEACSGRSTLSICKKKLILLVNYEEDQ